jgi:hypothetical protein
MTSGPVTAAGAGTWKLGDLTVNRMGFGAMRLPQRGRRSRPMPPRATATPRLCPFSRSPDKAAALKPESLVSRSGYLIEKAARPWGCSARTETSDTTASRGPCRAQSSRR